MEQSSFRLGKRTTQQLDRLARQQGTTKTDIVRRGIDYMDRNSICICRGFGKIARFQGTTVYCACSYGAKAEMDDISTALQTLADDLATMPEGESNAEQRADKQKLFDLLTQQYDALEQALDAADERETQEDVLR